jgi:hypothetical protein
MRGEPEQHPDWTIDTFPEEIIRGELKSKTSVTGGYARIRANLFDGEGRLIATGTKTEYSERFLDFVEKAETGAIARAIAVAGYGTEQALDLDEGYESDRIADAPVPSAGRAIEITPSAVEGLVQGGRSKFTTSAQLNEIRRLAIETKIGANIVPLIESVCSVTVPDLGDSPGEALIAFIKTLAFEQSADLIQTLARRVIERRKNRSRARSRSTSRAQRVPVATALNRSGGLGSDPGGNGTGVSRSRSTE